jgi:hypothetical protein
MDARGYGANPRGSTAQCFGQAAVEEFLEEHDMGYIIRAHEKTAEGITVSKGGRVLTVFSTSKDHHLGEGAMSACLLVDDGCIEVITKDPSYIARTERLRLASEQARRGGVSVTLAAAAAAAAADQQQQQQQHQQHGPVSGGPFSFSDDHLFGEGALIVQEEVVDVEIDVGGQSSAAAAAAPATVSVTQIVVTTSDAAVAAATAAAAGEPGRPLVLEINDQQPDSSADSDTPLDDEGTRAVPSLPPTSSTQKLQRRDSMDVGLFRQLRARAPPVVLQPSAEQSRAYCSTTAQTVITSEPLRSGDRSASRGSSISNASDASVSNDADSNTSTATVVRKHVRKGSAVSFDLDSESDSDDDEDNFTVQVPAAQPAATADSHSAVAHSNSVSSSSSSSNSVSSGSGSVTTTTASTTVAPSNGSVVWTDAVDAVSSALKAVGIGSKDSAKSSRDRSCSSSNSSDHSGRSLASQSPARRLRGRGRERIQRQPSPTVS